MSNLQRLIDDVCRPGGSKSLHLDGACFSVHRVVLGPQHNGLTVSGGTFYTPSDSLKSDKRYGIFELAKGISLRGVSYPDAPLEVAFLDCNFIGPHTDWTDDMFLNQARARNQGSFVSGINAMDGSRVDKIYLENCRFSNLYAGIGGFSAYGVVARNCFFDRIVGHCLVSSVPPKNDRPMVVEMSRCKARDCGSLFDFSAPDATKAVTSPVVPVANVQNCVARNILGRTKVHGMWDVYVDDCKFLVERLLPSRYYGISIPQARRVRISNCEIAGYPVGGIHSTDWLVRPEVIVDNTSISGGQMAVNAYGNVALNYCMIQDCYLPWGGNVPPNIGTVVTEPMSLETNAQRFATMREMVRTMDLLHGTKSSVDVYWYLPPEVRRKITEIETAAII